jgi:hypothetical protein
MIRLKTGVLSLGAAAGLVAALALAGRSLQQRVASEGRLAALAANTTRLEAGLRRAALRLTRAHAAQEALAKAESTSPAAAPQPASAKPDAVATRKQKPRLSAGEEMEHLLELTRDNPAVQKADTEDYRVQLRWYYGDFFRQLQLTDEQAALFIDRAAKRDERHTDLLAAARTLGISVYDPAVITLNQRDSDAYMTEQRQALGDAGVKEMQRYNERMRARDVARGLAGMATLAGEPLAPAQIERLADVIDAAARPPPRGPFPGRIDIDWARVDAEAKAILSPTQAMLFQSAESPGIGGGGARFAMQMNQAIMSANHAELMGKGQVDPAPSGAPR